MAEASPVSINFKRVNVIPAISRLAFGFDCPDDWKPLDIPSDVPDFSDPGAFMPLGVFMSPVGAILFSVAGRPGYEGGSVYEWTKQLLEHHGFQVLTLMPAKVNGVDAIRASAIQPSEAGPMQVAVAFFEDGGSIIHVTAMAPQQLWGSVEAMFEQMLESFVMIQPQGATVGLVPGQKPTIRDTQLRHLALSDQPDTLINAELKLNAYIRDNGIGLLPRVMTMHEAERFAVMASGAVMAGIPVPFGWHIFDDGKRALVFTPDNAIQINISVIATGGKSIDEGMDEITAGMLKEQPQAEHHKLVVERMPMLAFKGLKINGELLNQIFIFKEGAAPEGYIMQVRVTCAEVDTVRAVDLAGLIVQKMTIFRDLTE